MNQPPPPWQPIAKLFNQHEFIAFGLTVTISCVVAYLMAAYFPALVVGILLAYLLESLVAQLERFGCMRALAVGGTLLVGLCGIAVLLLFAIPLLIEQLRGLVSEFPDLSDRLKGLVQDSSLITPEFKKTVLANAASHLGDLTNTLVATSADSLGNLLQLVIYMVLIPMMVFFILRDKDLILNWFGKMVPDSQMLKDLKKELDENFAAYVRGKIIEASIIFALCLIAFLLLGVKYAFVLAVAVGLSVVIPFVGAVAVTIPVVVLGYLQFGTTDITTFWWMMGLYGVIQILDGQVIVPLLFSEVVKLHPAAILAAILVFGAIWGVWGVFFAIPLASLVKANINVIEHKLASLAPA